MSIKDLFIPQVHTKKRSKLLQHPILLSYVFFVFSLIISSYLVVLSIPNVLGYATDISNSELLNYTNERRSNIGLNKLVMNEALSSAARAKAADMFEKDYWAHVSPTGTEPWEFITAAGYDYLYAGENLAVDFSHSKSVVDAWYDSPSHKDNLLNEHYTQIGFAVVNGNLQGRDTTLIVQMFGSPRTVVPSLADTAPAEQIEVPSTILKEKTEELAMETVPTKAEPNSRPENVPVEVVENESGTPVIQSGSVLNAAAVFNASRFIAILLGLFLSLMFAVDGYYVRRYGILRISGHTVFHILLLVLAILGIWYTSIGLVL